MKRKDDENVREAAALKYNAESDDAPYVVALGQGYMAQRMVEQARAAHVEVVQDEKLAHMLQRLSIGDEIPEALYQVVAEVLVYVSTLDADYGERFGLAQKR